MEESTKIRSLCLLISLFSLSFFGSNVLFILFLDLIEFFHVRIEIGTLFEGDEKFCSLDKSSRILVLLVISAISSSISCFFNFNSLGFQVHIFSVPIFNQIFCSNDTDCGCISKRMKYQIIVLFKCFFGQIYIERLVLSVRNIDLVRFDLELSVILSLGRLHWFLALHLYRLIRLIY